MSDARRPSARGASRERRRRRPDEARPCRRAEQADGRRATGSATRGQAAWPSLPRDAAAAPRPTQLGAWRHAAGCGERGAGAAAAAPALAQPGRPAHARPAARAPRHDRLGRHDHRRRRDRALVKAFVVNPYRIPSSSMEPTLHCAQPAIGCEARFSDRVLANRFIYHLRDPRRGRDHRLQDAAGGARQCGAGGTFVKRLIGLPGDTVEVRSAAATATSTSTASSSTSRTSSRTGARRRRSSGPSRCQAGQLLHDGRQPLPVVRLARVGDGAAREPDRQGLRDLLAAEPHLACTDAAGGRER